MHSKHFLNRGVGVAVALLTLTSAAIAQASKPELSNETKEMVLAKLENALTTQAFVPGADFSKWSEMIEAKREMIEDADTENAFAGVVNSVLQEYGYSHISLFTPDYGTQRQTQSRAGIGIRIQLIPDKPGVLVTNVFPDSPASDVGLQPGDIIFEADGVVVNGVAELAGELDQKSTIKVQRGEEVLTFDVVRRQYRTVIPESVTWAGPGEDVAVVTIPTFDVGYNQANVEELFKEVRERAQGVVLDLRGNGGGRVVNLQHLAGFFLDPLEEPIGTFIGRRDVLRFERDNEPTTDVVKIADFTRSKVRSARFDSKRKPMEAVDVPVTVLIDPGSGSASEMMAKALQEYRSAKLIGGPSAGAVLASVIIPLGDDAGGFWVQFPMFDYVTIKGYRIEGQPITPDIEAPMARFGEPDTAVIAAVSLLTTVGDGDDDGDGTTVGTGTGRGDGGN